MEVLLQVLEDRKELMREVEKLDNENKYLRKELLKRGWEDER